MNYRRNPGKERSGEIMEITCKLMNFSKAENAGGEEIIIKNKEMNSNYIILTACGKEYLLEVEDLKNAVSFCSSGAIVLNED